MANPDQASDDALSRDDLSHDDLPKTDAEWREILTPEQFAVTRQGKTERAGTGPDWDSKTPGMYHCVCCGDALFDSKPKFDSGTLWPSYFEPVSEEAVETQVDDGWFSRRTEVHCRRCKAHLGHLFDDGPPPTGLRYCINGTALKLVPSKSGQSS